MDPKLIMEATETIFGPAEQCLEKWSGLIDKVKVALPDTSDFTLATTAICLENTARVMRRMDEATRAVNVGSFINHGFELIAAVLPSLIAMEVFSVQPMTRRNGEIFFMDFLYGTTRGNVTEGDTMFGSKVAGHAYNKYAADNGIEEAFATGNNTTGPYAATLNTNPIESVVVTDALGQETFTDPSKTGTLTGSAGGTGTINYETGAISVTYNAALATGTVITATYDIDFEANSDLIPEVDVSITSEPVTAKNWKIRARYTLDSAFDVENAFGRTIDTELKAALASEVRSEIDGDLLLAALNNGTSSTPTFDVTPPDASISYAEHKWTFYDKSIIPGSNDIFQNTRRAAGNFIVAGTEVCNVIEALAPMFKREGAIQPGPHYIGTLGDFRVYKNPFFGTKQFMVGYKGSLFMEAGLVYAPYLPIFTTRTVVLDDFFGRFGLMQSSAKHMVNPLFYAPGVIIET